VRNLYRLAGREGDHEITDPDDGLDVPFGPAYDRVNSRHQFIVVKGLGHIIVGAEAKTLALVFDADEASRIRIGVLTLEARRVRRTSNPDISGRFRSSNRGGVYRGAYVRRGVGVGLGVAAVGAAVAAPYYYGAGPVCGYYPYPPCY
jgi:hypothetical protein